MIDTSKMIPVVVPGWYLDGYTERRQFLDKHNIDYWDDQVCGNFKSLGLSQDRFWFYNESDAAFAMLNWL